MKKLFLLLTLLFTLSCSDGPKDSNIYYPDIPDVVKDTSRYPLGAVPTSTEKHQTTPKGVAVYGKNAVDGTQLNLIDNGIDVMYDSAFEDGFSEKTRKPYVHYVVFTTPEPCLRSPETQTPSFLVNAGWDYDGTEFDQYYPDGKYRTPVPIKDANGTITGYLYSVKDGKSVVFASEMVLGLGNTNIDTQGRMYLCTNPEVLKTGTQYGAEHMHTTSWAYTEENRVKPPYDGFRYANCSILHNNGVNHALLPRADRCYTPEALTKSDLTPPIFEGIGQTTFSFAENKDFTTGRILRVVN